MVRLRAEPASRTLQILQQPEQPGGGRQAELTSEERAVAGELAHRLRLVAAGQVRLDERGAGTLPERLCPYGRTSGADGFTASADGEKAAGKCFQGIQPQLPLPFGLDQHPIVVP